MKKHLIPTSKYVCTFCKIFLIKIICVFSSVSVYAQSSIPVAPIADAFVRNGTYASTNYGSDVSLQVKEATSGYARVSYLKFPLNSVNDIVSAKLRIYGYNYESTATINISVFGVSDSWTEGGITWNNAPAIGTTALGSIGVNNVAKYYELDVTNYVKTQFAGDQIASFGLKDAANQKKLVTCNSKENTQNQPQLVISTASTPTNAFLKVNFQDAATVPPTGWIRDYGEAYGPRTSAYQGSGNTYGWIKTSDNTPLDMTSYGRKRTTPSDILLATLMHMQPNSTTQGKWEAQVPNGSYEVTVSVGDGSYLDSKHTINIEGVQAIVGFVPTSGTRFQLATVTVAVADGRLTVDAIGGTNTKINYINIQPTTTNKSNALLFIQNLDKFPANNVFVTSRIQNPWTRDTVPPIVYNANHDTARIRIHNKGIGTLVINNLILSNTSTWQILKLKGVSYSPSALPLTIPSGSYADLQLLFIAVNQATRVKVLQDNLTIISNDDKEPTKVLSLNGLYQRNGEGIYEPTAQEILNTFGFKTRTGFTATDPDKGANNKPKGDEILSSYFLRADVLRPVTVRQMGAYHACCEALEFFRWYVKGSTTTPTSIFGHIGVDAQSLLPRRATPNTPAEGSFTPATPTTAFGFRIGSKDHTDTLKNPDRKIGVRVWKALDANGRIIPNSYIVSNDYLGGQYTNYDYNDNTYYVTNIKPEVGTVHYSVLSSTPSAVDFGEKLLQSSNSFTLNLKSLGQTYANGSADPAITITSVSIVGENKAEFTASLPVQTTLNPQATTTLNIGFNPVSEGLKIADLLIYYNNSTPCRVPLYGIGKAAGTTVSVPFRIKSGSVSSSSVTVNGKTWISDVPYAFDNLEPYANSQLSQISGTDEDVLYLREQSSNGDKRPFRYEISPIANGSYVVRLHFAEIYWGNPSTTASTSLSGGPGSRVMSVSLENQLKLINLDVAQEVGSAAAVIKNIPVTVTDGKLNINFTATVNRPMVCAVEVYKFSGAAAITEANEENFEISNELDKPKVYPNPTKDKLRIEFPSSYEGNVNLEISDQIGRVYKVGASKVKDGASIVEANLSGFNFKPGIYYLKIYSEKGRTEVFKIRVE